MSTWMMVRADVVPEATDRPRGRASTQPEARGDSGQGLDDEGDVLVEIHRELGGAAVHVVAVHGPREGLVPELLLDRRRLEPRDGPARPDQRARCHEAGQLIAGVERPVEQGYAVVAGV